jgi:hypothetical protein
MIKITIAGGKSAADIMVDEKQRISDAAEILKERGLMPEREKQALYRSPVSERVYTSEATFEESGIRSGDALIAI